MGRFFTVGCPLPTLPVCLLPSPYSSFVRATRCARRTYGYGCPLSAIDCRLFLAHKTCYDNPIRGFTDMVQRKSKILTAFTALRAVGKKWRTVCLKGKDCASTMGWRSFDPATRSCLM